MKFKVGDKVRLIWEHHGAPKGTVLTVERVDDDGTFRVVDSPSCTGFCWVSEESAELITKGETMGRRTFRLLKETDYLKRGAVFQEMCDDGDQDYQLLEQAFNKFSEPDGSSECVRSRDAIENNPKWYEEVFPATQTYLSKAELEAFKKWRKAKK